MWVPGYTARKLWKGKGTRYPSVPYKIVGIDTDQTCFNSSRQTAVCGTSCTRVYSTKSVERNRKGTRYPSVPYKAGGFDTDPSGKGTQRNPPSGNPHGGEGVPFSPLREYSILILPQQGERNVQNWTKCRETSSATSGLQFFLLSYISSLERSTAFFVHFVFISLP